LLVLPLTVKENGMKRILKFIGYGSQ